MDDRGDSHRLERWVHRSLLTGLTLSGLMLAAGLVLTLARDQPRTVSRPPAPAALLQQAVWGGGVAWLDLGLLVLIGTPVLRVAVLAAGWGLAGERRFAAVALVVLGLLGVGLLLGLG